VKDGVFDVQIFMAGAKNYNSESTGEQTVVEDGPEEDVGRNRKARDDYDSNQFERGGSVPEEEPVHFLHKTQSMEVVPTSHASPEKKVLDMPIKNQNNFNKLKKIRESKRNLMNELEKRSPGPESPQLPQIVEPDPKSNTKDNEIKKRLGFREGLGKNSQFLDEAHSEEGIEIYIKAAPPGRAKVQPSDFNKKEIPQSDYFMIPPEKSPQGKDKPQSPSSARRQTGGVSPKKTEELYKSNPYQYSTPEKQSPARSVKKNDSSKQLTPNSSKKKLTFVPNTPLVLQESLSTPLSKNHSEKKSEILRKHLMESEKSRLNQSSHNDSSDQKSLTPRDHSTSPPSQRETPNKRRQESISEKSPLGGLDSEDNFENVIDNVSRIDTKRNLQEQLSSGYAVLEVLYRLRKQKRNQIEKLVGSKCFHQIYNSIKSKV
jgi:hypothetical protein